MTNQLAERAMLVSLHISSWSGMAVDKEVTEEVNESHKADKAAGRYNKRLVATKFLSGISTAHTNARATHRLLTLPWEDDGTRILAANGFITYSSKLKDCRLKAEAEVKALKGQREAIVRDGRIRLGTMFDEDDYPSNDDIMAKFGFDVEIKPIPEAGDFRAQLSNEATAAIVKDIERRTQQRLENAMNDVFQRVVDAVSHMAKKLRDYVPPKDGNRAEGVIRDSLIGNIHELASTALPILNITDDPRVAALQQQLLSELVEHSPEILRADAKVRAATISNADKLLRKVRSYMT
jgi:hypothetical protein